MQHVVNKNYIERNNIFKTLSIASRNKRRDCIQKIKKIGRYKIETFRKHKKSFWKLKTC